MIGRRVGENLGAVGRRAACVGLLATLLCGCHSARHQAAPTTSSAGTTTTTTTPKPIPPPPPIVKIAPLPVRPVTKSQPASAQKCPATDPNRPVVPTDAITACDIGKTTAYTLGPESMQLGLLNVDPPKALTADFYEVTLILDPPSAAAWASYTAAHLQDHVAFVRGNLVLEAPIIEDQVTSGRIALTTQTTQGAAQLAQLAGRPS
ncbi:preprotein translocase subunit SecD [Mycobacterium sp. E3251]|uniref:preprotein translocase subunit SecD n=1 Tax=Mycobacterium sp. E3251 TaxID=1834144 RepID=UPI0007FCA387|nr:preprotein translocase subunit SecD [Mycobacterium sp. E3251]OBG96023.1 preprotein translocase subunit SecD [Mycobacterium sp. E3251]